jgi:RHS repeat-associated protein
MLQIPIVCLRIYIYIYGFNTLSLGVPTTPELYGYGELFSQKTQDEDGHFVITYKDKDNKLIAKMTSYSETNNTTSPDLYKQYNITYYVYDDVDNLRFVITPEAYKASWMNGGNGTISGAVVDGMCYQYAYDNYGRMVTKKLPGKSIEYIIYDKRNRPVLTQDGNMRKNGKNDWFFTIYDVMDRPVNTGIYSAPGWWMPSTLSGYLESTSNSQFTPNQLLYYLTHTDANFVRIFGLDDCLIYTTSLYDDYNHTAFNFKPFTYNYNNQLTGSYSVATNTSQSMLYRGMLTGQFVRILDDANGQPWAASSSNLFTAYYYDNKERLIQVQADNHMGGTDVDTKQYDFAGMILSSVYDHTNPNAISPESSFPNMMHRTTIVKKYYPDYIAGINTKLDQNVNNAGFTNIYSLNFDALHRLANKTQNIAVNTYSYNIRNWLTGINKDYLNSYNSSRFFSEQLFYDDGNTFPSKLYSGDVSGNIWKGYGTQAQLRSYGYSYDYLNRLTNAMFNERRPYFVQSNNSTIYVWDHAVLDYTMSDAKYDMNGNILQMKQRGTNTSGGAPIDMDLLSYEYAPGTNSLLNVKDVATVPTTNPDFKDYNNTTANGNDYMYDDNGNLITDLNKNIYDITYNYFNKPQKLSAGLGQIEYRYDGLGNKLEKVVTPVQVSIINPDAKTDYVGPFVYEKNNLKFFSHEEGRCRPVQTSSTGTADFYYDYFVKDYRDNVRCVVNLTTGSPADFFGNPDYYFGSGRVYKASHEVSFANAENLMWSNIDEVRDDKPDPVNWDEKAAKLDGMDSAKRIGTAIMLRVMPGDQFKLSADSYHKDPDNDTFVTTTDMLSSLLATLAGGSMISGQTVAEVPESINVINNTFSNPNLAGLYENLCIGNIDSTQPLAFLNYLVFDERFNLIPEQSGAIQVKGNSEEWTNIALDSIISIGQAGYLSVFISSQARRPVYFDHIRLLYYKGNVLEENHYYPYGLTISTATNNPLEKNNIKFTSKELQSESFIDPGSSTPVFNTRLETYDFDARMQDPQIGRWWQMDPLAELAYDWTPYRYGFDNPVSFTDPNGMFEQGGEPDEPLNGGKLPEVTIKATHIAHQPMIEQPMTFTFYGFGSSNGSASNSTSNLNNNSNSINPLPISPLHSITTASVLSLGWEADAIDPEPITKTVGAIVLTAATVGLVASTAIDYVIEQEKHRTWVTYTLTNSLGQIYVGRASGYGSPQQVMNNRFAWHHMRFFGYGNPTLDKPAYGPWLSSAYNAIRGREQQLIDAYGGIGNPSVGNRIRAVARDNRLGRTYWQASNTLFGNIADYTGKKE